MSLQVWLPLTKDTRQQGLSSISVTGSPASWGNGKLGKCATWNGAVANVLYNNTTDFNYTDNFSVAFWANPVYTGSTAQYAWTVGRADAGGYGYGFQIISATTAQFRFGNGSYSVSAPSNEWHHFAMTIGNSKVTVYKDGIQVSSNNLPGTIPTYSDGNGMGLGCFHYSGNIYPYYGSLNDFRIYDHCLSPMEIKELAKGLVLHYPLNRQGWGQENLYTGSRDFSGTWVNSGLWTTSSEVYNGFTVKERSATWGGLAQNVTATNGDIFTISFYAKVASGGNIQSVHRSNLGNVTTGLTILGGNFKTSTLWVNNSDDGTQWKRYWATVQIVSSDITYLQWRIENSVADKKMSICGMKLEKGSIATPWCPNSSDTLATITGLNSTTEYDCSGFCNNGTRTGTFTWTSDTPKYNVSQYFQDYTRYITTPLNDWTPTSITLSCWIKSTNKTPRGNWHIPLSLDGQKAEISIGTTGKARIGFTIGGTRYAYDWGNDILNGTWHLITNVFDGNSMKMYVDGVLINSSNVSGALQSMNNLYVGRFGGVDAYGNTQLYESDVRIYATALSATDVLALYQNSAYIDSSGNVYGAVHSEV